MRTDHTRCALEAIETVEMLFTILRCVPDVEMSSVAISESCLRSTIA